MIDYSELEASARAEIEPLVVRLRGLVRIWIAFLAAENVGAELRDGIDQHTIWGRYALTNALVTDYVKPWTKSSDRVITGGFLADQFLDEVTATELHSQLIGYRNNYASHISKVGHAFGVGLAGPVARNQRDRDDEFEVVSVPLRLRLDHTMTQGLEDADQVDEIVRHVVWARELTEQQVVSAMEDLHVAVLRHSPVLDRLVDLLPFAEVSEDDDGERNMPEPADTESPAGPARGQAHVDIGGRAFVQTVLVWTRTRAEIELTGPGFRIAARPDGQKAKIEVEFRTYSPDQVAEPAKTAPGDARPEAEAVTVPSGEAPVEPVLNPGNESDQVAPGMDADRRKQILVGLAVLAALIVGVLLLTQDDSYTDVYGVITINESCDDLGGYGDIPRMQVIVRDLDGEALAAFEPGLFNGVNLSDELAGLPWCINRFEADKLAKRDAYIVDSGRRGEIIVNAESFEEQEDGRLKVFDLSVG